MGSCSLQTRYLYAQAEALASSLDSPSQRREREQIKERRAMGAPGQFIPATTYIGVTTITRHRCGPYCSSPRTNAVVYIVVLREYMFLIPQKRGTEKSERIYAMQVEHEAACACRCYATEVVLALPRKRNKHIVVPWPAVVIPACYRRLQRPPTPLRLLRLHLTGEATVVDSVRECDNRHLSSCEFEYQADERVIRATSRSGGRRAFGSPTRVLCCHSSRAPLLDRPPLYRKQRLFAVVDFALTFDTST
jgi:hypothetical protein